MSSGVSFYLIGHKTPAPWFTDWMRQQQYALHEQADPAQLQTALLTTPCCLLLKLTGETKLQQVAEQLLDTHGSLLPVIVCGNRFRVTDAVLWMQRGAFSVLDDSCMVSIQQQQLNKAAAYARQLFVQQQSTGTARHKLAVLSGRELAVARLVAQGLTAAQVAQQLYISPRTAEAHKANIFKKLHIKSSTALAQLVLQSTPVTAALPTIQRGFSTVTVADAPAATA